MELTANLRGDNGGEGRRVLEVGPGLAWFDVAVPVTVARRRNRNPRGVGQECSRGGRKSEGVAAVVVPAQGDGQHLLWPSRKARRDQPGVNQPGSRWQVGVIVLAG